MVIAFDKKYNKVFVTLTDDYGENKGGYFCQVYTDENFQNEIDNFCLHHEDCENQTPYEIDEMIEQVIALSNYSKFFQN